MSMSIVDLYSA